VAESGLSTKDDMFYKKFIFYLCLIISFCIFFKFTQFLNKAVNSKEIILEIKDMKFGNNNPTIYLKLNEKVRFTIYNLDPGILHNFTILETDVFTKMVKYKESDSVYFLPTKTGKWIYLCVPHASMMRGIIIVEK
jgi:plastocyanin